MKVLMINSVCGIRSTGRICTDLAQILEEQGHTVKIAYGRETVPEQYQKYAVRIGSDLQVKLHGVKARLLDCAGFGSTQDTKKFIEWVRQYDPDVIHLHNIHGYYINIAVLMDYLRTCGKKIIWTLHDCWSFTGHCAHFTAVGCDQWQTQCNDCCQKHTYPKSILFSNAKSNFENKKRLFTGIPNLTIVTPSRWLADLVKKSFLKDYPVQVIPNGIDLSVFKPTPGSLREQFGLEGKKIVLGVASAWDEKKGLYDFYRLAEQLGAEYQVVLIGLSEKQLSQLPPNILGICRTNSTAELAQWYTAADVFANPTWEDTYPTVNLEAIACQTPVVTYRTGGSPESVPQENGIVVSCGNLEDLKQAVIKLSQCEFRAEMTAKGLDAQSRLAVYLSVYTF